MKTRITILMMALLMVVSVNAFAQKKGTKTSTIDEVTFVTNMHCKNCEKKCDANLPFEKGVKDYKSNLDSKTIYFKFDTRKTSREKLAEAIQKLGYTATEIETVQKSK